MDVCKQRKCILPSYSRLKGIYPANCLRSTTLAIFMLWIHKTGNNNNSPAINYKNAFGIMNLNNFIVRRPTYVKAVLSLTLIRINSDLSYQQFLLITDCFGAIFGEAVFYRIQHFICIFPCFLQSSSSPWKQPPLTISCVYFQKFL